MWQAEILTLFPAMVTGYLEGSILGKARARGLLRVEPRDIRAHAEGRHRVCGRYEGVDERVRPHVDEEISLGDFVLTGGELVALAVVDAVGRLLPGVLGNADSPGSESFEEGLLEYPQYTRPPEFRGASVPEVLQGGDHARIARWRRWHQLQLTRARRPDLLEAAGLSDEDRRLLQLEEKDL